MVQIQSPSCIAMALPLKDVQTDEIRVAELGLASDGTSIMAAFLGERQKLILDLTPLEDDWLPITAANLDALPHHTGESVQSLHMAVKLNSTDEEYLNKIDAAIRGASGFKPTQDRVIWKSLHAGEGKMVLNMVLEGSAAPTPLWFISGGAVKKGTGLAFLNERRGSVPWKDFMCKVKVLLECIHRTEECITVTVTVLGVIFAPTSKRTAIEYEADEEAAALRSAKRFKYQF